MKTMTQKSYYKFKDMAKIMNNMYLELLLERSNYDGIQHSALCVIIELVIKLFARLEDFTSSAGET